jgi:hypothetical protein
MGLSKLDMQNLNPLTIITLPGIPKIPLTCEADLPILCAHAKGNRVIKDIIVVKKKAHNGPYGTGTAASHD